MSLSKIISELSRLKPHERDVVRQACVKLNGQVGVSDPPAHLLMAIAKTIGDPMSMAKFKRAATGDWRSNAQAFLSFVDLVTPGGQLAHKTAVTHLCLEMLVADMNKQNMPVNLVTLCVNLPRIAQVFDEQFPDYRKAGLTWMILKQIGA